MGYDVHITRKSEWHGEGPDITLDEWLGYVASDASMRHDGDAEATTPAGDVLRVNSAGIAVWTGYTGHGRDGNMAWFSHAGGNVVAKNPDPEILDKMVRIAKVLGATVQGDEGEHYPAAAPDAGAPAAGREGRSGWGFLAAASQWFSRRRSEAKQDPNPYQNALPRFYSHDFPRYPFVPPSRRWDTRELPGVQLPGETLGEFLYNLAAETGVRVVPHDPPQYFRYFAAGSDTYCLVDIHIYRSDAMICPKQDLAFPLLRGDVVDAGILIC